MKRRDFLKMMAALAPVGLSNPLSLLMRQTVQQFFLPPTVHHVTETGAVIFFQLAQPTANGQLFISKDGTAVQEYPLLSDTAVQQIFVEGLEPSTTYQYQVIVDGIEPPLITGNAWSNLSFTTPPYEWPVRLTALGDTGFGDAVTLKIGKYLAQHDLDLFLHLGDVVYFMQEYDNNPWMNWAVKYFAPFQDTLARVPHYPTFGNHELDAAAWFDDMPSYFHVFPPFNEASYEGVRSWYSFDYNGIQFLSLNSQVFYSNGREVQQAQETWLDSKLARQDIRYTVIFFHVAPYSSSSVHQWDGQILVERWLPKFENAFVPLVLNGHVHAYERLTHNNINLITSGSASETVYPPGDKMPNSLIFLSEPVYPIIELYEDRIHLTSYNINNEVIEAVDLPVTPRF